MDKDPEHINQLIARYLASEASEEERKVLEQCMQENPGIRLTLKRIQKLEPAENVNPPISDRRMKIWNELQRNKRSQTGNKRFNLLIKVAASILLIITSIFIVYQNAEPQEERVITQSVEMIHKVTAPGQKLTFQLPDGSKVRLNAESQLSFPSFFEDGERIVKLTGEAFFEVEKDSLKPFIVQSGHVQTRVLGTSFNVRAYVEDENIEVALLTGKVQVNNLSDANDSYIIDPGQVIHFDSNGDKKIDLFNYQSVFGWKEGLLIFTDTEFREIIKKLSRWYGVTFHIEGERPVWKYNGTFSDASLEEVLEVLSSSERFNYQIDGKKVKINL